MPEGDTLHNVARVLRPMLVGERIVKARLGRTDAPILLGREVIDVEAIGKHLLIHCGSAPHGWVLRVHLGMHGSWHSYSPAEVWRRPAWQANVVVETPTVVAVCFNAEDVECLRHDEVHARGSRVAALGPDLLAADVDFDAVVARVHTTPESTPLVDVLLNQHLAAGVGNVYKCEVLFLEKRHPLLRRDGLDDAAVRGLFVRARELMLRNVGGGRRVTTTGREAGRLWVYARKGEACWVCGAVVEQAVMGAGRRSTFWCPACQASGIR